MYFAGASGLCFSSRRAGWHLGYGGWMGRLRQPGMVRRLDGVGEGDGVAQSRLRGGRVLVQDDFKDERADLNLVAVAQAVFVAQAHAVDERAVAAAEVGQIGASGGNAQQAVLSRDPVAV